MNGPDFDTRDHEGYDDTPISFDGLSKTDRNGLRNAYRELRHNGHPREVAREWVSDRLAELA